MPLPVPLIASPPKLLQISTFADAVLAPHCCAWARWSGQQVATSFEGTTWTIMCLKPSAHRGAQGCWQTHRA